MSDTVITKNYFDRYFQNNGTKIFPLNQTVYNSETKKVTSAEKVYNFNNISLLFGDSSSRNTYNYGGLTASQKFKARITGYQLSNKNIQNASGLLGVADEGLASSYDILSKIKDLINQASGLTDKLPTIAYSSDTNYASIAATAVPGADATYQLEILDIATPYKIGNKALTSTPDGGLSGRIDPTAILSQAGFGTAITSGSFKIGNSNTISYNSSTDTMNTIINKINSDLYGYVTASYDSASDRVTVQVNNGGKITTGNTMAKAGFGSRVGTGTFTLNGQSFNYSDTKTVQNFIDWVNANTATTHVSASYDAVADKMVFQASTVNINPALAIKNAGFDLAYKPTVGGDMVVNGVSTAYTTNTTLNQIMTNITNNTYVNATYDSVNDKLKLDVKNGGKIDSTIAMNNIDSGLDDLVTLNGSFDVDWGGGSTTISYRKNDSIDDVVANINADVKLKNRNISASYDSVIDKFTIQDADVGETITVTDNTGTLLGTTLHMATGVAQNSITSSTGIGTYKIDLTGSSNGPGTLIPALQMTAELHSGTSYTSSRYMGGTGPITISDNKSGVGSLMAGLKMTPGTYTSGNYSSSTAVGTYNINVNQITGNLMTALHLSSGSSSITSSGHHLGGPVNPNVSITSTYAASGKSIANLHTAVTAGTFSINGSTISISSGDTLNGVINKINASSANVTASYDSSAERIFFESKDPGASNITFASGTSNFLSVMMPEGTEVVNPTGSSTFKVNGITYNRTGNYITDVIPGAAISLYKVTTSPIQLYLNKDIDVADNARVDSIKSDINTLLDQLDSLAFNTTYNDQRIIDGSMKGSTVKSSGIFYSSGDLVNSAFTSVNSAFSKDVTFEIKILSGGPNGVRGEVYAKEYGKDPAVIAEISNMESGPTLLGPSGSVSGWTGNKVTLPGYEDVNIAINQLTTDNIGRSILVGVSSYESPMSNPFSFLTGPDGGHVKVDLADTSSYGLELRSLDLGNEISYEEAMAKINSAMEKVDGNRNDISSLQKRLEYMLNYNNVSLTNLNSATSQIRDVALAEETLLTTREALTKKNSSAFMSFISLSPDRVLTYLT